MDSIAQDSQRAGIASQRLRLDELGVSRSTNLASHWLVKPGASGHELPRVTLTGLPIRDPLPTTSSCCRY